MLSVRIERMLRALGRSIFIVGTNELKREALSDQELVTTYKEQGGSSAINLLDTGEVLHGSLLLTRYWFAIAYAPVPVLN